MFVGTPLVTSDYCFISCVLRVEQSVPENNIRCTVFLKHRTNWDNVRCAVKSFTWSTIMKSVYPLEAFDLAIREVLLGLFLPLCLCFPELNIVCLLFNTRSMIIIVYGRVSRVAYHVFIV